jgi:hypothetical protein
MSFTPTSLLTLAKWIRFLGCCLILRFFLRTPVIFSLAASPLPGPDKGRAIAEAMGIYGAVILLPAVILLLILRPIEDGKGWAYSTACIVSLWSVVALIGDRLIFSRMPSGGGQLVLFELAMLLPAMRVGAALLIAWPDLMDVIKTRRRENRVQGFEPIMPRGAGPVLGSLAAASARASSSQDPASPATPIAAYTNPNVDAPVHLKPRFVPQNLSRGARLVRDVGGIMLFVYTIEVVAMLAAATRFSVEDFNPVIALSLVSFSMLLPGAIFFLLGRRIDLGPQWPIVTAAAVAVLFILAQVLSLALFHPGAAFGDSDTIALLAAFLGCAGCGFVLIFCGLTWRDAREVSRALARDRMQTSSRVVPAPKWTTPPPPAIGRERPLRQRQIPK